MSLADEIQKLEQMRTAGTLSEEEFTAAKARLINEGMATNAQARMWLVALHLSQFAGYAVPLAGFVAPVLIWQLQKDVPVWTPMAGSL